METLLEFNTFVKEILADNSRNYKISVLEKYKDNENIKYYLNYIYNPFIITGISDKKLSRNIIFNTFKVFEDQPKTWYQTSFDILERTRKNNTGSDQDIYFVQLFRKEIIEKHIRDHNCDPDVLNLFDKIITKNLQLGIDAKSINKVITNLIPTFNVQLANKYFEDPARVDGKEFAITTKIDGCRIIAIKKYGKVDFYTRQGQKYEGLVDLEKELLEKFPDNICLDGEITLLDKGKLDSKNQYKQTVKIVRKDGEKHGVKMLVFDWMRADDFENQNCTFTYDERRAMLENIFKDNNMTYFNLLPILYKGTDVDKITELLNENVNKGEEGVMINICSATYKFTRTWDLIKVKKMQTLDLEIVNYEEGSNSNTGKLGAFIVRYKDNNLVKVGSGFSKELREEIWKNPSSYIGKIIEVQYFEETKNQNGGLSLRFPVFIDFRDPSDKNTPDF